MASTYKRLLDPRALSASTQSPDDGVLDLGAYRQLVLDARLLKVGTGTGGGRVKIQHAAVNEPDAWRDLAGVSWVVDSTGTGGVLEATVFLRYIRWVADASVAGAPVVLIDLIAKE